MRVSFLLPSLHLTGGVRVVCEHARGLIQGGHQVRLLAPRLRWPLAGPEPFYASAWKHYLYERYSGRIEDGIRSYGLESAVQRVDPQAPASWPIADATVATAWETAEWLERAGDRAGTRGYLIQQYEAWTPELAARVDRTWTLPFRRIVIAHWLERLGLEKFGQPVWACIPNGVDSTRFHPAPRLEANPRSVGCFYDQAPWKGASYGLEALWKLHARSPGTRIVLLGRPRLREAVPPGTVYHRDPAQAQLPAAYREADVFLSPSLSEGFSLVTLEAMASGCALVATAVGEVPEMGTPDQDYLMVPARDSDALARAALLLLQDPARWRDVSRAGLALARSYSWQRATDMLVRALK